MTTDVNQAITVATALVTTVGLKLPGAQLHVVKQAN
jgi:hypothetical protein